MSGKASLLQRQPFKASDYANDGIPHLLIAASGSVATIKLPQILQALSGHKISIRVILTASASEFLKDQSAEQPHLATLHSIPNVDDIYQDSDEWEFHSNGQKRGWVRGDPILHIELRKWSDMMVIAPLSANTMAKIVNGISDGLLLSVIRAWDTTGEIDQIRDFPDLKGEGCILRKWPKRILVATAMNTAMWKQPITKSQLKTLEEDWGVGHFRLEEGVEGWFEVLRPQEKTLACGDVGDGAMKEWTEIVSTVEQRLGLAAGGKA